jgi:putative addiction module component (TIGR02574 family)
MSAPLPVPPPGFDELPVDEQIAYAQSLSDRIAAGVDQVPLADWQRELLEERLAAHRAAPHEARPWEEALERLERRLRPRSDPPNSR